MTNMTAQGATKTTTPGTSLAGTAELVEFQCIKDARAALSVAELGKELPFVPRRLYWIHGGIGGMERGGHAHYELQQLLIPMFGEFQITIDNGERVQDFRLSRPSQGLLILPVVWRDITQISPEGTLVVVASMGYDEADYIRDKEEFYSYLRRRR